MSERLLYFPLECEPYVRVEKVHIPDGYSFDTACQKQECIRYLHNHFHKLYEGEILEISTKSSQMEGVQLSAFNLCLYVNGEGRAYPVENIYQSSKVFENGGPYTDMYGMWPRDAKHDPRLKSSGALKAFEYEGVRWELEPKTAFYDYLYVRAVKQSINSEMLKRLVDYRFFTDIEFNPQKSINTQARAVVLVKLLMEEYGEIPEFTPQEWIKWHVCHVSKV